VTGDKWIFTAKATVTTMNASFGGGFVAMAICYVFYKGKVKVEYVSSCMIASMVAIAGASNISKADENSDMTDLVHELEAYVYYCYFIIAYNF
jgi:hypothetical protein